MCNEYMLKIKRGSADYLFLFIKMQNLLIAFILGQSSLSIYLAEINL